MSNSNTPNKTKYRPSLTSTQILHILTLAKGDIHSAESLSLIKVLAPFQAKIEAGAVSAAYTTTKVAARDINVAYLGGEEAPHLVANSHVYDPEAQHPEPIIPSTKEEYWEACYNAFSTSPELSSLTEIQAAKEHMYLHDLMTPEQEAAFEATPTDNKLFTPTSLNKDNNL